MIWISSLGAGGIFSFSFSEIYGLTAASIILTLPTRDTFLARDFVLFFPPFVYINFLAAEVTFDKCRRAFMIYFYVLTGFDRIIKMSAN